MTDPLPAVRTEPISPEDFFSTARTIRHDAERIDGCFLSTFMGPRGPVLVRRTRVENPPNQGAAGCFAPHLEQKVAEASSCMPQLGQNFMPGAGITEGPAPACGPGLDRARFE